MANRIGQAGDKERRMGSEDCPLSTAAPVPSRTSALVLKIQSSISFPSLPPQILFLLPEPQDTASLIKYPDSLVSVFLGNLEGSYFNSL